MSNEYYIIKRDGQKDNFDPQKIINAILKAFIEVDGKVTQYAAEKAHKIAQYIEGYMEGAPNELTIDEIQSLVEHGLMATKRKDVATAYIEYRHDRDTTRRWNNKMMNAMKEKLAAEDTEQQNANVDEYSFGGRKGEAHSVIDKQFALDECMSKKSRERHLNNEIYIHDLGDYAVGNHNCLTIPFDDLLKNGFNTRQTDVRPANSVNTAFQLVAVIFQLQSLQQFGGVSASHLDWTMVPYVRKSLFKHYLLEYLKDRDDFYELNIEKMTEEELDDWVDQNKAHYLKKFNLKEEDFRIGNKLVLSKKYYQRALCETRRETYQAVEGMYHNLNTLQSRSGNQLPFTSINYGTCTLPEGRMIIKALLEGSIKGVGKFHKTSIFPCGIFQYMKGVNDRKGTPNYDLFRLALKSTAKRLYPNYANVDWSGNAGYDRNDPRTYFSTMGCRTANGWDINGFGQLKDGRGNICPVTIILPTIAMEALTNHREYAYDKNGNKLKTWEKSSDIIEDFMKLLDEAINDAKDMLIERFEYICSQDPSSAKFMYENGTMKGYVPEEGIRSALKHGTLAIGQLGLAECLQVLIGCDHTEEKGMELAKRIEGLFRDKCARFKEDYKLNFGVYYTPAENLCYTAMKKFQAKYGKIENVSDREYFTNSMHVPVWQEISPFEKIDLESQLTGYSSAGCITYIELDSAVADNIEALESIVNYAMDHDIPYFAVNVPNDLCMDCGYSGVIDDTCPECGGPHIQRLRRVTGYLTGDYKTAFNKGKIAEVEDRYKHSNKLRGK
jgi:ribonucleoside-triphosphate reductase